MAIGFVLITIAPTHEHDVSTKLSKVSEIIELHPLFGEYDLLAKIKAVIPSGPLQHRAAHPIRLSSKAWGKLPPYN